jgi:hypothetical protein
VVDVVPDVVVVAVLGVVGVVEVVVVGVVDEVVGLVELVVVAFVDVEDVVVVVLFVDPLDRFDLRVRDDLLVGPVALAVVAGPYCTGWPFAGPSSCGATTLAVPGTNSPRASAAVLPASPSPPTAYVRRRLP